MHNFFYIYKIYRNKLDERNVDRRPTLFFFILHEKHNPPQFQTINTNGSIN